MLSVTKPSRSQVRRWRRFLADERAEVTIYQDLAARRDGDEREILLALAEAERRHESHWSALLGDQMPSPRRWTVRTRAMGWAAHHFGSVFVLALAQRAETRTVSRARGDVPLSMVADEAIHAEVVRGLAARGRQQMSGSFRAAVFGANDGLVSNLALVLGIGASGVSAMTVLVTGVAGLLAGAFSMAAGEYVSVSSQRELLASRRPNLGSTASLRALNVQTNELALVYRAHGLPAEVADARARLLLEAVAQQDPDWPDDWSDDLQYEQAHYALPPITLASDPTTPTDQAVPTDQAAPTESATPTDPVAKTDPTVGADQSLKTATDPALDSTVLDSPVLDSPVADSPVTGLNAAAGSSLLDLPGGQFDTAHSNQSLDDEQTAIGTPWGAAGSSFLFFASGAVVPVLPYMLGVQGLAAVLWSAGLVGLALLLTGGVVGVLSGSSPARRALRQLAIGWGAAAVTYLFGWLFNTSGI
jgi:VIT1/CCC1 family predicted Fe2+/Mn2+ transporter